MIDINQAIIVINDLRLDLKLFVDEYCHDKLKSALIKDEIELLYGNALLAYNKLKELQKE